MLESVLIAACGALGSVVGSLSGIKLITYRIEQLEKRVDKHNCVVERQYDIEKITAVLSEDLKVANHRIEQLEKDDIN